MMYSYMLYKMSKQKLREIDLKKNKKLSKTHPKFAQSGLLLIIYLRL